MLNLISYLFLGLPPGLCYAGRLRLDPERHCIEEHLRLNFYWTLADAWHRV